MPNDMKQITEQDLTLLYYGEHQDPKLASRVAQSEEHSARFRKLSEETIETYVQSMGVTRRLPTSPLE